MSYFRVIGNVKISIKLIGGFLTVALLAGALGVFALLQINTLVTTMTKVTDVNVEQADLAMELVIEMEALVITVHAAMLGEAGQEADFVNISAKIEIMVEELHPLLVGKSQEDLLEEI